MECAKAAGNIQFNFDGFIANSECPIRYTCNPLEDLSVVSEVFTPWDPRFVSTKNNQFGGQLGSLEEREKVINPSLILLPANEAEILSIVDFAKRCDYAITVRSGGHHYRGFSSCNRANGKCLQILMDNFQKLEYLRDAEGNITSIVVGPGVKLGELQTTNAENGVIVLSGTCSEVGAGGHFQTGAEGSGRRALGLGVDWLKRIRVITSDGTIHDLFEDSSSQADKDLFWAIAGGSPGSWGVVTEYEFYPIFDADFPHFNAWDFNFAYTSETLAAMMDVVDDRLINPYVVNNTDYSIFTVVASIGTQKFISSRLRWIGKDYGSVFNAIPGHPEGKTWHEELIQPFYALLAQYSQFAIPPLPNDEPISYANHIAASSSPSNLFGIPPLRFYNSHASYTADQRTELLTEHRTAFATARNNALDFLAIAEPSENLGLSFLLQYRLGTGGNFSPRPGVFLSEDPMLNSASAPFRRNAMEIELWVMFGSFDPEVYAEPQRLLAKLVTSQFEKIISQDFVQTSARSFAYLDQSPEESGDLDAIWEDFYDGQEEVYVRLRSIKSKHDCSNVFSGYLTVAPFPDCAQ